MANTLAICPALNELYALIDKVPKFPLNNRELVSFASRKKAPKDVVDFYKSFNESRVYSSREELAVVSEQVDMMRQSESDMPHEIQVVPEEY